jgi:DNA-binding LacI/PurR family transcriptional regulator
LLLDSGVEGIICSNDLLALGVMQACKELGIRIPEDMALMGGDDILAAAQVSPALTTLRSAQYEIGREAMRMLLAKIDEEFEIPPDPPEFIPQLIVRESAPARAV